MQTQYYLLCLSNNKQYMMNIRIISTVSVVLVVTLVGFGIVINEKLSPKSSSTPSSNEGSSQTNTQTDTPASTTSTSTEKVVNSSELASATGKGGNPCYVVVDNVVYSISGFALWADGLHSPSGGRARCGKDLSSVIGQSPHGKSKLNLLQRVGVYQP